MEIYRIAIEARLQEKKRSKLEELNGVIRKKEKKNKQLKKSRRNLQIQHNQSAIKKISTLTKK